MTSEGERKGNPRYPIIVRVFSYLTIQVVVLMLLVSLRWPVVDLFSFVHVRRSAIPPPVWVLFWAQVVIGLFMPLRGKAYLLGQFFVFALAYLLFGKTEQISGRGDRAVVPFGFYTAYGIQFFVMTGGIISLRYRKSKALPWYPLIAYFAVQLVGLSVISEIRMSFGRDAGNLILLAFVCQCIGLSFAPNRFRLFVAAEVLVGASLVRLPHWLPMGWYSPHDSVSDWIWIAYLFQCTVSAWWFVHSCTGKKVAESESHPSTT